ncbi:MAG: hypothetical protein H6733_01485 [Alphaproteobacteria bacterium]|nr:hypothetical protein [Alphaproteobacteria bacterium]
MCIIAGLDGELGSNGDDLPALETLLYFPTALTWSPQGRLVIDDFNNMRIRELQDDGTLVTLAGSGFHAYAIPGDPARSSPLENPVDISFLPDGRLLISELHAARILVLEDDGTLGVIAGTGQPGFSGNGGPAVDAELSESAGVATDTDGRIYVADTDNDCLRVVDTDGSIRVLLGDDDGTVVGDTALSSPQRVRVQDDRLLVADTRNHTVRALDLTTGNIRVVAGTGAPGFSGDGGPAEQAALFDPYSAVFGPDGSIYIADSGNHRIRKVDPDGTITTVAGTGEEGSARDGVPATQGALSYPVDMLPGPDGALYIADMKNGVVRRVAGPASE